MEWWILILVGIAGGVIGGMGMGGGTLLIPMLTMIVGIEQLDAQLINLVSFVPMAIVTVIIHAKNKLIDFRKVLYVLPTALLMSIAGAFLAGFIDKRLLKIIFGVFLIVLSVMFLSRLIITEVIKRSSKVVLHNKICHIFIKRRKTVKKIKRM